MILDAAICPSCESKLMEAVAGTYFETSFTCAVCRETSELGAVVEATLGPMKAADDYEAVKDGGEPSIGTCPSCSRLPTDASTEVGVDHRSWCFASWRRRPGGA